MTVEEGGEPKSKGWNCSYGLLKQVVLCLCVPILNVVQMS
jgi:hypothetical protein